MWEEHRAWADAKDLVPEPPSTYYYRQIYGCFFATATASSPSSGSASDNVTFETDYPHTDSTWPCGRGADGRASQDVVDKVMRTNAAIMLHLDLGAVGR